MPLSPQDREEAERQIVTGVIEYLRHAGRIDRNPDNWPTRLRVVIQGGMRLLDAEDDSLFGPEG